MKTIKILFYLLVLNSCATENIVGIYGKCKKPYYACNQIKLNPDGTYEYLSFEDVGGQNISKGKWKFIKKNIISLNSNLQPINPETIYIGKTNTENKDNYKIKISDNGFALGFAGIEINEGELKGITDKNGVYEFKKTKVKSIKYSYLNQSEIIYVKNFEYNEVEIFTRDILNHCCPIKK